MSESSRDRLKVVYGVLSEFSEMPKGELIKDPTDLVHTDFILNRDASRFLGTVNPSICFTRKSLKHISEKGIVGRELLRMMPETFAKTEVVLDEGDGSRFLLARLVTLAHTRRYQVVVIERASERKIVIVTSFIAKQKYLKNFKILWRTATSK